MSERGWVERKIEQVVDFTGIVLLLAITILTLLQVLVRYVIRVPFMWSEEFIRFLFIWMVWVGAVLAIPRGTHMVIEYFRDHLFGKKALAIKFTMQIFSLVFLVVVVIKGWSLAQAVSLEYHITFPISVKYAYLVSVVCGGLMFFYLIIDLWRTWKDRFTGRMKNIDD